MKILITSGGCKVPIDDVRHIGNFSSGRYGSELAYELWSNGHEILFFHEKGSTLGSFRGERGELPSTNITFVEYKDYYEYLDVKYYIKNWQPDIIISAAAISDYIVDKTEGKISSDQDELTIKLKKGEKVIKSFRDLAPKATIVGFKLLVGATEEDIDRAVIRVFDSGADLVVYNDLLDLRKGMTDRRLYYGHNYSSRKHSIYGKYTVKTLAEEILVVNALNKVFE